MSYPIQPTPILYGKAAEKFEEEMKNPCKRKLKVTGFKSMDKAIEKARAAGLFDKPKK